MLKLSVGEEVLRTVIQKRNGKPHVAQHRRTEAGLSHALMDDIEEPFGRELGRTGPDRAAGQGSAGDSDTRRADPRDQMTHPGRGEGGEERIAAHAGQCDGRNPERGQRGDPLRRFDGQAERPHAAQRGTDDRDLLRSKRVEQRRELCNRVLAQRSPRVVKRVAGNFPNPGRSRAISRWSER